MVAIDPPIRLDGYPDEPIDSTEAAAKFIERHDGVFLEEWRPQPAG
jgi:hypothetical protein